MIAEKLKAVTEGALRVNDVKAFAWAVQVAYLHAMEGHSSCAALIEYPINAARVRDLLMDEGFNCSTNVDSPRTRISLRWRG